MTPHHPPPTVAVKSKTMATPLVTDSPVNVKRLPIKFVSDDSRVISLPFMTGSVTRVQTVFERIDGLTEPQAIETLDQVKRDYSARHKDILAEFEEHYRTGASLIGWGGDWSEPRRLLAGAYLTMEYAIESAALFNPSIVAHPDQSNLPDQSLRIVMSLRATGEGHVSSIVFRTGMIGPNHILCVNPPTRFLHRSRIAPDRHYFKHLFQRKLQEMAVNTQATDIVLAAVPDQFTLDQLHDAVRQTSESYKDVPNAQQTIEAVLWLARSNYHVELPKEAEISEQVIYPISEEESKGIEDLRLVRFVNDDGSVTYYGTYTAYNGLRVMPMMISTKDFYRIEIHSLNGACAQDKGMALFPRRIGGHYVMCSRNDGENLYLMVSDYAHFWESATRLTIPKTAWEFMQIGNCGSPLETPEGWLLLTHGVGPMRTYSIGALLLDLDDPQKIIGHLKQPLLTPLGDEREGYVPNVVYSCGALIHRDKLYLPYALADKSTSIATIDMDELLNRLLDSPPA